MSKKSIAVAIDGPDWFPYPSVAMPAAQRRPMYTVRRTGPPLAVRAASALMLLRVAFAAVTMFGLYQARDTVRTQVVARYPGVTATTANHVVDLALTSLFVGIALWTVLYLWLTVRVRRGGATARAVAIAGAWLAAAAAGWVATQHGTELTRVFAGIDLGLDLGIIVLLSSNQSWDWAHRFWR